MPYGYPPSHRDRNGIQPEVCELCGAIVPQAELRTSMVEGLRGRKICSEHPAERAFQSNPSYNDYAAIVPLPQAPDAAARHEPIGAEFWWIDPENP